MSARENLSGYELVNDLRSTGSLDSALSQEEVTAEINRSQDGLGAYRYELSQCSAYIYIQCTNI